MKYCSKCGNQMLDEAVMCVNCGCMVNAQSMPNQGMHQPTPEEQERSRVAKRIITDFSSSLTAPLVLSIIGVVLSFGIGFIFAIISNVLLNNRPIPEFKYLDEKEQILLDAAIRKHNTIKTLINVTCILLCVAIMLGIIIGLFMVI